MIQRLNSYELEDASKQRERLVALWRLHHPQAATESSDLVKPFLRLLSSEYVKQHLDQPDEIWINDVYNVTIRRHKKDPVFGTFGGMIQLGISTFDGTARHDWREFQQVKNQLAGPECEAFELYPAESRLMDPSNYYTLWCFPGVKRLKIGRDERYVLDAHEAFAPQRAFRTGG